MNAPPKDPTAVSRDLILEELERIVSSQAFEGSERSTKLLCYLVDHAQNGQTTSLKEYTLGTEVLGKGSSFDPRIDTIVRAEASRLRNRLEKYYAAEGHADALIISLPKGSYVPQFLPRSASGTKNSSPRAKRHIPFAMGITAICVL